MTGCVSQLLLARMEPHADITVEVHSRPRASFVVDGRETFRLLLPGVAY